MTVVPILLALASAGDYLSQKNLILRRSSFAILAVRFTVVADIENVLLFSSDIASALITVNVGLCTLLITGRIWSVPLPKQD